MNILSIDPGPTESAWLEYDTATATPTAWDKAANETVLRHCILSPADLLAVEMFASYGMPVGAEVFASCVWVGRYVERWAGEQRDFRLVFRSEVKMHLTHSMQAKDSNIRAALMDRYGPGKELAVGRKASPGPLYGMKADCWSALAVAITAAETPDPSREVA